MKNIFRKNQMMIVALALVIAVAGYLNFTSRDMDQPASADPLASDETVDADAPASDSGYYDGAIGNSDDALISANVNDDIESSKDNTEEAAAANEGEMTDGQDSTVDTDSIGETVFTSASVAADFISEAKLGREQMRAKSKEILNDIIANESLSEDAKKDAVDQLVAMTDAMQKESQAEQQLGVKGFTDSIVSISEKSVDVSIAKPKISDVEKSQIEDIVMRKTGCEVGDIVITTMGSK